MPVKLIFEGEYGADAATQMMEFIDIIINGAKPVSKPVVKPAAASPEAAPQTPVAEADAKEAPADKPVEKSEEKPAAEEPAKEEAKPTSSRRKAAKKDDTATDSAKPAAEAETTSPAPEFTAPAGFNDAVKPNGEAIAEVVKAAYEKVEQFRPKEGEPVSLNYCRALLLYMAAKKGMDHNRKMLDEFGVKKIQDLAADRFGDFALKMTEALKA